MCFGLLKLLLLPLYHEFAKNGKYMVEIKQHPVLQYKIYGITPHYSSKVRPHQNLREKVRQHLVSLMTIVSISFSPIDHSSGGTAFVSSSSQ
jgi:hypothetical protein